MEGVEFVLRHRIEDLLDLIHALEVARRIEHEAAPREAWCVLDGGSGNMPRVVAGEQLHRGDGTVEQANIITSTDLDAGVGDLQFIPFGGVGGRGIEAEADLRLAGVVGHGKRGATVARQHLHELAGSAVCGLVVAADKVRALQYEVLSGRCLVVGRQGDQRRRGGSIGRMCLQGGKAKQHAAAEPRRAAALEGLRHGRSSCSVLWVCGESVCKA
ncbi:hypothetical protein D3C81_1510450 [compost metagenome]